MVYKIYTNEYLNELYNRIVEKLSEKDKEIFSEYIKIELHTLNNRVAEDIVLWILKNEERYL